MTVAELTMETVAVDLARECVYRFLAAALSEPGTPAFRLVRHPHNQNLVRQAADLLRAEAEAVPPTLGFGELPPVYLDARPLLGALQASVADLEAEHQRVFGLVANRECPPYETEYHAKAEPFFCSQQMADIGGFYQAFGLSVASEPVERLDHVALELEFLGVLLLKKRLALAEEADQAAESAEVCDEAIRHFFRDHVAWWVPSFTTALRHKAGSGFYLAVAELLAAFLPAERSRLGVKAPRMPLQPAPIDPANEPDNCSGCPAAG